MKNLDLKNITLVAVSSIKIDETILALKKSMQEIEYHEVVLITHQKPDNLPNNIKYKQCKKIGSINEYNNFILYNLINYIESDFVLIIQHDGYVLNPNLWSNEFLDYDYIGAPWHGGNYFANGVNIRVGNGGFSLRSKKLLNVFNNLNISFKNKDISFYNEDAVICVYCRKELETYGLKFAPVSIASIFSVEEKLSDSKLETFGFHTFKKSKFICLKRFIKFMINRFNLDIFKFSNKVILGNKNINL